MSNTKREPVLSNADLNEKFRVKHNEEYDGYAHGTAGFNTAAYVRDIYEAARAKDAELIQMLVDALEWVAAYDNGCPLPTWEKGYNNAWSIANSARAAAAAAEYKPSGQ